MFVTGTTSGPALTTIAYNPVTGAQLWAKGYAGPGSGWDLGQSIAVSPTGDKVFVTGHSPGAGTGEDYATIAYAS